MGVEIYKFPDKKPGENEEVIGIEYVGIRFHAAIGWYMKCKCYKKEPICRQDKSGYHFCSLGKVYEVPAYWIPLSAIQNLFDMKLEELKK